MTALQQESAGLASAPAAPSAGVTTRWGTGLTQVGFGLIALLALLLAWQGSGLFFGSSAPVVVPGIIDDTAGWHTNLAATTCSDYTSRMTPAQRLAAAQQLLASFRRTEVSNASAGAEMAPAFVPEISTACTKYYGDDPTTSVIAGAVMAWTDDLSLHPAHN